MSFPENLNAHITWFFVVIYIPIHPWILIDHQHASHIPSYGDSGPDHEECCYGMFILANYPLADCLVPRSVDAYP